MPLMFCSPLNSKHFCIITPVGSSGHPKHFFHYDLRDEKKKWSVAQCPSVQITWGCPPGDGQSVLWRREERRGERSALKLWLKRKLHLFVSSSAAEMLSIPLPLIFKLFAWKAPSERFQLWRHPCINSSEELPLLGVQVQRPAKSSAGSFWIGSHTMTGGHRTKRSASF